MKPLWYKSDRAEPGTILALVLAGVLSAWAFQHGYTVGHTLRECPAKTPDGRGLLGINLTTNECRYSPIPRPALDLSPTELRRMARQREIMK